MTVMDTAVVTWVLNGLVGIVLYFMKTTLNEVKDQINEQRRELELVKQTYYKRADFSEFKTELWARLDKMETDFQRALDKR